MILFLERVCLKNYRSIAQCDVRLGPLTFFVGPNGSGKSNFLDALRFVSHSLRQSLEHALRDRGGIGEVRRRSSGHPPHFGIRLEMRLPGGARARYAFVVGARQGGEHVVKREECEVLGRGVYRVEDGELRSTHGMVMPVPSSDRLYLVDAASLPPFRPVYDALQRMSFFNPVPDVVRRPQQPDPGVHLARDGSNLASVFDRMPAEARERVAEYLGAIVPGVRGVSVERALGLETFEFRQDMERTGHPWRFKALSMSEGSLRAFGVLVALFHRRSESSAASPLLTGLEEPEKALHPAAAGVLFDALMEACESRQVLVTTHSPDLLDRQDVATEMIRAVTMDAGRTIVGRVDRASREVLKKGLYTPGELLRLAQLEPDAEVRQRRTLDLFAGETPGGGE